MPETFQIDPNETLIKQLTYGEKLVISRNDEQLEQLRKKLAKQGYKLRIIYGDYHLHNLHIFDGQVHISLI